jgi:hypothetical protein
MAWMLHNGRLPRKITEGVSMLVSFQPAVMREGQVHKGPDYYKSSESGHAPVIYKTRDGCKAYIVCHEGDLAEANQKNRTAEHRALASNTNRRMYFYQEPDAALSRFRAMCQAQVEVNRTLHQKHTATRRLRTTDLEGASV